MLNKSLLPPSITFYQSELGKLSRPLRGWARGNCPFHESRSKTSFSVNLNTGGFYCFGCQVKGGNIVDFTMLKDKVDFKTACRQLGAWQDSNGKKPRLRRVVVGRDLVLRYSVAGLKCTARVKDDPKNWLDLLRRIYAEAGDRLGDLHRGDYERFPGETETCWGLLADSWELIWAEVGR